MSRGFNKISRRQAAIDGLTEEEYVTVSIPTRATINSAGYDIRSAIDMVILPQQAGRVPTGLRAYMLDDEVLLVHIRSSLGFKYNVRLANATGVIDSDYYHADNEGHIWLAVYNDGELPFEISCGDRIAQGIFMKYLTSNDVVNTLRTGGVGSTGE